MITDPLLTQVGIYYTWNIFRMAPPESPAVLPRQSLSPLFTPFFSPFNYRTLWLIPLSLVRSMSSYLIFFYFWCFVACSTKLVVYRDIKVLVVDSTIVTLQKLDT